MIDGELSDENFLRKKEEIESLLDNITNDQRIDIFYDYCVFCGKKDPNCRCWDYD